MNNNICVIGCGYVGLVVANCLAKLNNNVTSVDLDVQKIKMLNNKSVHFFEPGLEELLNDNIAKSNITFTNNVEDAISNSEIIYVAVGTPSAEDDSANLEYVNEAINSIIEYSNEDKLVIVKSTIPVGTSKELVKKLDNKINKTAKFNIEYCFNPEFLRQGTAIIDFDQPDRVVIGTRNGIKSNRIKEYFSDVYSKDVVILYTDVDTAEMAKYASNSFLATKISYINELGNLCNKLDISVKDVVNIMGFDNRINPSYMQAGIGYGGSCFPKDVKALINLGKDHNINLNLLSQVDKTNKQQIAICSEYVDEIFLNKGGRTIGILGLSFKPNTCDLREAPSCTLVPYLANKGYNIRLYDPKSLESFKKMYKYLDDKITYCNDEYEALKGTDGFVLLTEWNQFLDMDFNKVLSIMNGNTIFDLRNTLDKRLCNELGFEYFAIGG